MDPALLDWIEDYEREEQRVWTETTTSPHPTTNTAAGRTTSRNSAFTGSGSPPLWTRLYEDNMSLVATSKPSTTFEMPPEGPHIGRCYRVIDLGVQTVPGYEGAPPRDVHQVQLSWELLGEAKMADGRPFSIHKTFTVSTHEKSSLRQTLEAWRGRKFTEAEVELFDITAVLGVYGFINVTHTHKGDKSFANIASIMPLPREMAKPPAVNTNVLFDMDNRDMAVFASLSQNMQAKLTQAKNWNESKADDFVDDIPF